MDESSGPSFIPQTLPDPSQQTLHQRALGLKRDVKVGMKIGQLAQLEVMKESVKKGK